MYILNWKPNVGKLVAKRDVKGLVKALNDGDAGLRYRAASALGDFNDHSVTQALIEALYDEHLVVRYSAADALTKIGNTSAVPAIRSTLKDRQWIMRKKAVLALGGVGDESDIPVLVHMLRDEDEEVRKAVVSAICNIGGSAAVRALMDALTNMYVQHQVQYNAALALHKLGPEASEAVPSLVAVLANKNSRIRDVAVWALMGIGPAASEAVPALIQVLNDAEEDWDIRYCAAAALAKIRGEDSVPSEKRPFFDLRELSLEDRIIELVTRVQHLTRERRGVTLEGAPANHWFRLCGDHLVKIGDRLHDQGGTELMNETYQKVCNEGQFRGRYLETKWRETKDGWKASSTDVEGDDTAGL